MKASVVDLRYRTSEIFKALARREKIQILYHGKVKGVIHPTGETAGQLASEHPFFGMAKNEQGTVVEVMQELRGGRYR